MAKTESKLPEIPAIKIFCNYSREPCITNSIQGCPVCKGKGTRKDYKGFCLKCKGTGEIKHDKR